MPRKVHKMARRRATSFSFSEETLKLFEDYCSRGAINRSRLVEDLVVNFLKSSDHKPPTKDANNETLP